MTLRKITPRLNVHFSFSDLMTAVKGILIGEQPESGLQSFFPGKEIYFTNHARTGIKHLLSALDLPQNSGVGVLVYNCHTVFKAINQAGHKPVFIDATNEYKLDVNDLKKKISQIDALIVTHLFGIPSDVDEIKKLMGNKPIIEDCAHAFLNKSNGKLLGTFGVGSAFSFGHAKFPSAGEGGFVVINDSQVNERFLLNYRKLKKDNKLKQTVSILKALVFSILMNRFIYGWITYPLKKKYGEKIDVNNKYGFHEKTCNPGFRFVFEKRLLRIINMKENQINNSKEILSKLGNSYYFPPKILGQADFMIPVQTDKPVDLISRANSNGIEFGQHFDKSMQWAIEYGYVVGNCPTVEKLVRTTVTIPCHYKLSDKEINKIRKTISK